MSVRRFCLLALLIALLAVPALAEKTYVLPENLKRIETQGFAGIVTDVVVFPDGIEFIAEDAFDGVSFVGAGSADIYAQRWCEEHDIEYRVLVSPLEDFEYQTVSGGVAITKYNGHEEHVRIPEEIDGEDVIAVGSSAFQGNTDVRAVTLPRYLEKIEKSAFRECTKLGYLRLNEYLETIGDFAFFGCTGLKEIVFNDRLDTIGESSFQECKALKGVDLPESLSTLGWRAFRECESLAHFGYPVNVRKVGGVFLYGCTALEEVTVPEGVYKLMDYFIADAGNVKTVNLPSTLEEIGVYAFAYNNAFTTIDLPDSVTKIGDHAFYQCYNLTEITLPPNLDRIEESGFQECTGLTDIDLPASLTYLGWRAFRDCSGLTHFGYPVGIKTVGGVYLFGCTGLTEITVPEGVTKLMDYFISGNTTIAEIHLPSTLKEIGFRSFAGTTDGDVGAWETIDLPDGVELIGEQAFANATNMTSIDIPGSVTGIEIKAFDGCTGLKTVTFHDGLKVINHGGFRGCSALKEVILPDTLTTIGSGAFKNCSSLRTFRPSKNWDTVYTVGPMNSLAMEFNPGRIFEGCDRLRELTVPEGTQGIPGYAYSYAPALETVHLPDGMIGMGVGAFFNCKKLREINFPDGMTHICYGAFKNCESLKTAMLPDSITTLCSQAFQNCVSLTEIHYPKGWKTVESPGLGDSWGINLFGTGNVFGGDYRIKSVEIPEGALNVAAYAFQNCTGLTSVTVPQSVTWIGPKAFENCSALPKVYIGPSVTTVEGNQVFSGCEHLTVWCEYGSTILDYCRNNNVDYYYLSPDGISIPSGSIYEGEGSIYGYARTKCSDDESVVLTEIQATIWKNGSIYRQKTVNPGVNDCNMASEFNTALALYTLPLGSYRFTLTAKTALSSETWADTSFTVIEKIPVFSWHEYKGNPTFVAENATYSLSGKIICNFPITDVKVSIKHSSTGAIKNYSANIIKPMNEIRIFAENLNASDLVPGENTVSFIATAAGKTQTVHSFIFYIGAVGEVSDEIRQQIIAYCNDSNQWSLREYSLKISEYQTKMSFWDKVCMAWSDYSGRTRQYLMDGLTGSEVSTYQVRLYEADIAEMIQEMYERNEVPQLELPSAFKDLKNLAKVGGGVSKAGAEEILAKYKDEIVLTWDNKIENIFQIELDNLDKLANVFKTVDTVYQGVKWSNLGIDAICEIWQDHAQALEVLKIIMDTNAGDKEFKQAVQNLAMQYESEYGAGLARICYELSDWARDKIFGEVEKQFLEHLVGGGAPYLTIANVVAKVLLKVTGVTDHGDAWQTFYTRYSSQQLWANNYSDAVSAVVASKGNPTDEQIKSLQLSFSAYKTATIRALEALVDLDKDHASEWQKYANEVRRRTIPGIN